VERGFARRPSRLIGQRSETPDLGSMLLNRAVFCSHFGQAVDELAQAGGVCAELTRTFSRLLRVKPAAQYQASSVTSADAGKAVQWAMRMLQAATDVVRS
jgi:hypothetical protein